jgi:hypothetical protein
MSHRDPESPDALPAPLHLAAVDVDADLAQRMRAAALAELASPRRASALPALRRWLEPAIAVGVAASYLIWAVDAALLIYR